MRQIATITCVPLTEMAEPLAARIEEESGNSDEETARCDFCNAPPIHEQEESYLIRYSSKSKEAGSRYECTTACLTCAKQHHLQREFSCCFCPASSQSRKRPFLFSPDGKDTRVVSCLSCRSARPKNGPDPYFDFILRRDRRDHFDIEIIRWFIHLLVSGENSASDTSVLHHGDDHLIAMCSCRLPLLR